MSVSFGMALALASSSLGCGGHHARERVVVATTTTVAPVFDPAVARDLCILQTSPRWRSRDDAAHRLGKVDWRRHPEVPAALSKAMLHDCEEEVREEAAESLGKLRPCIPEVHEALTLAANGDPDSATRRQARKALKKLGKACTAPCDVCGPGVMVEGPPVVVEPGAEPVLVNPVPLRPEHVPPVPVPADEILPVNPSPEMVPSPLPDSAPFGEVPQAKRETEKRTAAKAPSRGLIIRRFSR